MLGLTDLMCCQWNESINMYEYVCVWHIILDNVINKRTIIKDEIGNGRYTKHIVSVK